MSWFEMCGFRAPPKIIRIIIFNPQRPSLPIVLSESASERKCLSKETCFSLPGGCKSWNLLWERFFVRPAFSLVISIQDLGSSKEAWGRGWGQDRILTSCNNQVLKRAQRFKFWVWRPPGGVGDFHAKGGGVEKFVPSLESSPGISQEFCWDVPDLCGR